MTINKTESIVIHLTQKEFQYLHNILTDYVAEYCSKEAAKILNQFIKFEEENNN